MNRYREICCVWEQLSNMAASGSNPVCLHITSRHTTTYTHDFLIHCVSLCCPVIIPNVPSAIMMKIRFPIPSREPAVCGSRASLWLSNTAPNKVMAHHCYNNDFHFQIQHIRVLNYSTHPRPKLNKGELWRVSGVDMQPQITAKQRATLAWVSRARIRETESECVHTCTTETTKMMLLVNKPCLLSPSLMYRNKKKVCVRRPRLTFTPPSCCYAAVRSRTNYDQNTPLTTSWCKWEEMKAVSARLQRHDAVISGRLWGGDSSRPLDFRWAASRQRLQRPTAASAAAAGGFHSTCLHYRVSEVPLCTGSKSHAKNMVDM